MLDEIKFIQNIGRFETAQNIKATFKQCTLIFGENGWGKSTLADIFRSLTTNNPCILVGRKTLTPLLGLKPFFVSVPGSPTFQMVHGQDHGPAWPSMIPRLSMTTCVRAIWCPLSISRNNSVSSLEKKESNSFDDWSSSRERTGTTTMPSQPLKQSLTAFIGPSPLR